MFEELDKDIQNLESQVREHERKYAENPLMLGYIEKFYSHKECSETCQRMVNYLKELRRRIAEENKK